MAEQHPVLFAGYQIPLEIVGKIEGIAVEENLRDRRMKQREIAKGYQDVDLMFAEVASQSSLLPTPAGKNSATDRRSFNDDPRPGELQVSLQMFRGNQKMKKKIRRDDLFAAFPCQPWKDILQLGSAAARR